VIAKEETQSGTVVAHSVSPGQFPGEYFVQLNTVDGMVRAFFPSHSVDESTQKIKVLILFKDGCQYLVNLPSYTLTTGPRAWFSEEFVTVEGF
jgi:hypothetical protein